MASPVKDVKARILAQHPTATVSKRGKGSIEFDLGGNRKAFVAKAGNNGFHFGAGPYDESHEVDTAWVVADPVLDAPWRRKLVLADYNAYAGLDDAVNFDAGRIVQYVHPGSGEYITFQPQQLQWTNDINQIDPIGDVLEIPAAIEDDTLRWIGAYGTDLDFEWQTQTTQLVKRLIVQNAAAVGAPPQYIIDGGNPVLRLQFIFARSSGIRAFVNGVEFQENNQETHDTIDDIEFRLTATGEVLWYLRAPRVYNADIDTSVAMRIRATSQDLFVEVRTPWNLLQSAGYPLTIDPTVMVATGNDDAYEDAADGDVWNAGTECKVATNQRGYSFQRFSMDVPQGTTCDSAVIATYCTADDDPDFYIYADDVDNSAQTTQASGTYEISNRTPTTATELWDVDNISTGWHDSPSIVSVCDEIFARGSWVAENYIGIIFAANSVSIYQYYMYDGSSTLAAELTVEYTGGGTTYYQELAGTLWSQ